jgi:vancomycin resistance protein YoaR
VQAKTTRDLWSADSPHANPRVAQRAATRPTASASGLDEDASDPSSALRRTRSTVPRHDRGRRTNSFVQLFRITVVAAAVLAAGTFLTARMAARGEVYPGVQVFDVAVGGLSEAEARARLADHAAALGQTQVVLAFGDRTTATTLAELGVTIDGDASAHEAMGYGRRHHIISGFLRPLGVGDEPVDLPFVIRVDQAALERALIAVAHAAGIAPADAGITLIDGRPAVTPDRDGVTFDVAAARRELVRLIQTSSVPTLNLTAIPQPAAIRAADIAAILPSLEPRLSAPMVFTGGGRRWTLSPADLAGMIRFTPPSADRPAGIALDAEALRALGERLAAAIDRRPTEPAIDESGDLPRLVAAAPGRIVRLDDFVAAVQDAFARSQQDIAIPIGEIAPATTTDDFLVSLGIAGVVATGTSDFAGSEPGRATNVRVAAELVDGVLVPPGGTFSFNRAIGEINATPGFVPAGASENGIPGTAVGGGVCQVTTTVFRAVLKAGFPVAEWWPHAYRNIYYEQGGWAPGFDASVQQPDDDPFGGSDFIFENPTDGWLLIRAEIVDTTKMKVDILAAPTGFTVEIDDPIYDEIVSAEGWPPQESVDPDLPAGTVDLVQPPRDGMTMTVVRRVYDRDDTLIVDDTFVSRYEPQGASYRVSPDMAGTTAVDQ